MAPARRPAEASASASSVPWIASAGAGLPYLDLRSLYVAWWPVVDFVVFAAIFVGVAHATVGKRLEGNGGQLVATGLGAMLALGALGTEWALGINLSSLGPLAGIVIFTLLAVSLVRLLSGMGLHVGTAVVLTLLLLTFAFSLVSPAFGSGFLWIQGLLQLAVIGAVLFVILKKTLDTSPARGGHRLSDLSASLKNERASPSETGKWMSQEAAALKGQKRSVTGALRPISRRERKAARKVLAELKLAETVLRRDSLNAEDRQAIAAALGRIPPRRQELADMIARVRNMARSFQGLDNEVLKGASATPGTASVREKSAGYRIALDEKDKIGVERRLDYLETFVERYDQNAAGCAQKAAEMVLYGDMVGARKWICEAVRYEEEAIKMIERTRALEKMIIRADRREIRAAKGSA